MALILASTGCLVQRCKFDASAAAAAERSLAALDMGPERCPFTFADKHFGQKSRP